MKREREKEMRREQKGLEGGKEGGDGDENSKSREIESMQKG